MIDRDFKGEMVVILFNFGSRDMVIKPGERIAQLICERVETPEVYEGFQDVATGEWRYELADKQGLHAKIRGDGGFGSTGR